MIEEAARLLRPHIRRTPLIPSLWLSDVSGGEVWLKCENLQVTGSFKVRGAIAAVAHTPGSVAAVSAGNHGIGVAFAARLFGRRCTVFVPRTVPRVKADAIRTLGADLVVSPFDGYDDTHAWALERMEGMAEITPESNPWVIAGNGGTTGLEIFEQRFDAVVAPFGAGGLANGIGMVAKQHGARVIAVNTEASPGLWLSRRRGRAVQRLEARPTLAEGLEGGVTPQAFELAQQYVHDVVVVTEATIRRAVVEVLRRERMLIEGSAAAAVAAILEGSVPRGRLAVVLTGSNIDLERFKSLV